MRFVMLVVVGIAACARSTRPQVDPTDARSTDPRCQAPANLCTDGMCVGVWPGFFWDGARCVSVSQQCRCYGDCDAGRSTLAECVTAHAACGGSAAAQPPCRTHSDCARGSWCGAIPDAGSFCVPLVTLDRCLSDGAVPPWPRDD